MQRRLRRLEEGGQGEHRAIDETAAAKIRAERLFQEIPEDPIPRGL